MHSVNCQTPQHEATNGVLSWGGVAPTSVPLRNAIKGVGCVQTSVTLRNAIKRSCLQKAVYTYVSYYSQHCPGASGLIVVIRPQRSLFHSGVIKSRTQPAHNSNKTKAGSRKWNPRPADHSHHFATLRERRQEASTE